jgi:hypothetical protein
MVPTDSFKQTDQGRTLVENLRSHKLATDAKVELKADGQLLIDGDLKVKIKKKTMKLIQILGIKTDKLEEKYDGYIMIGRLYLHRLLTEETRDADKKFWLENGWNGDGRFVVLHLDDKPYNFNIENLVNAPQSLNLMLKKTSGWQRENGKWCASFRVQAGRQTKTKIVPSQAEALHAVDVLKMELVPKWARDFVFKHGLNRPKEFLKYYTSPTSLLERSSVYQKRGFKEVQPRKVSSKRLLVSLPFKDASSGLKTAVKLSNIPFDSSKDVMVFYRGARGKEIYFLVEKDFYESEIKVLDGTGKGINMDGGGYLCIGNHAVSRMVLGLEVGSFAKTGLQGCHKVPGSFGKLDNRKRVLKVGTQYDNNKDQKVKFYI